MIFSLAELLERVQLDPAALNRSGAAVREDVHLVDVDSAQAVDAWRRPRALVDHSGHWPVLLGQDDDLSRKDPTATFGVAAGTKAVVSHRRMPPANGCFDAPSPSPPAD